MAAEDPNKKYVAMENYLNAINSQVISLKDNEIAKNNKILINVTDNIIAKMREIDTLFKGLYREKFYGGSYYDGLKVGKPNEFDLDLILHLPDVTVPVVQHSDMPGFVKVEITEFHKLSQKSDVEKAKYEKLPTLLDGNGNFLSTDKVLKWMEGVMDKALKGLPADKKGTFVRSELDDGNSNSAINIYAKMCKGGPAFTLKLTGTNTDDSEINLDIDLVPCFDCSGKNWPSKSGGYRSNTSKVKDRFLVVPKKPKEPNFASTSDVEKYWRLSFQEQERELISVNKRALKPAVKLLKKLRDKYNHKISSYFIKTIFLWSVEKEDESFWNKPLSEVFMVMLKKYEEFVQSGNIPYYWNERYNLIGDLTEITKSNIANALRKMIAKVDNNIQDPARESFIIGTFLLSKDELELIKYEHKPNKKELKQMQLARANSILSTDTTDSATSGDSPLEQLGFGPDLTLLLRQFSDSVELKQRQLMEQFNGKCASNEEVKGILKKMDQKMDAIMDKLDQVLEDNKNTKNEIDALKQRIRQLEIQNRQMETGSIDALLNIRDIENARPVLNQHFTC